MVERPTPESDRPNRRGPLSPSDWVSTYYSTARGRFGQWNEDEMDAELAAFEARKRERSKPAAEETRQPSSRDECVGERDPETLGVEALSAFDQLDQALYALAQPPDNAKRK